ncbi:MAG: hypothetical protein NTY12_03460 [Candidatus Falkowbacteria bacterium]|nr:hypothetical protein [Candidatus Falkowbacteria bacterium]
MKNKMTGFIVLAVVLIAGAFYGGMKYGQTPQALQSLSAAQRQQIFASARGANGQGQGNRMGGARGAGGFANGEILSQTDKNITVKLRDGSSKIVLLADSTKINKSVAGQKTDLAVGSQVTVNGTANSDGTITAEGVTIMPLLATPPAGANGQNIPAPTGTQSPNPAK